MVEAGVCCLSPREVASLCRDRLDASPSLVMSTSPVESSFVTGAVESLKSLVCSIMLPTVEPGVRIVPFVEDKDGVGLIFEFEGGGVNEKEGARGRMGRSWLGLRDDGISGSRSIEGTGTLWSISDLSPAVELAYDVEDGVGKPMEDGPDRIGISGPLSTPKVRTSGEALDADEDAGGLGEDEAIFDMPD
jgi:hypothetical protein